METFSAFNESNVGTYVGARLDAASTEMIVKLQKALGIKNPLSSDKFHVTVLYSRNKIDVTPLDYVFQALPIEMESWQGEDGKHACVLKLNCPELSQRHNILIHQGGTHDYPDYQVHLTLSYDHEVKGSVPVPIKHINIIEEYVEPLDLNWVGK